MLPWVCRGQEPLCVGSAHEPLGWVLDLCPLHGGHAGRAQPAPQFTAREARARRRPLAPSATQFIRGLLRVPAAADTGAACARRLGSLEDRGSSGKQALGQGLAGREGAMQGPAEGPCGPRLHVQWGGQRPEGSPAHGHSLRERRGGHLRAVFVIRS